MKLKLANVRLAFPDLWTARPGLNDSPARFGAKLIMEPGSKALEQVEEAMKAEAKDVFGASAAKVLKSLGEDKKCLRDGDNATTKDGDVYGGFEGMMYLAAFNKKRPLVLDRDGSPTTEEDGILYSGCYVHAIVDVYALDKRGQGKSINCSLGGIKFARDGEELAAGHRVTADEFDDFEDVDDDDFTF